MLEDIQAWNFASQVVAGGLFSITVLALVALVFARNNKPVVSDVKMIMDNQEKLLANKLFMYIAEHEAHQINDSIDDKREAARLA